MSRNFTFTFLALTLAVLSSLVGRVYGDQENIRQVSTKVMFTAQAVASAGNATSSDVMTSVGVCTTITVQWTNATTGGAANFAIVALESLDGVGFYQPSVGGTITTVTNDSGGIAAVAVPMAPYFKLKLVNLSSSTTPTVNATVSAQ